jgi:hypothetical protein
MKFTFLLLLLLSFSAFAKDKFDLNLDVYLSGNKITSGRIIAFEGQEATLEKTNTKTNEKTLIKMIATNDEMLGRKGILVKLKIEHTKLGNKKVREQEILVLEDKLAGWELEIPKQVIRI